MTPRLSQVKPKELVRILQRMGFILRRKTGSHAVFRHPVTKNIAIVPIHSKDIKRGLLFGILKQAGISEGQFFENL